MIIEKETGSDVKSNKDINWIVFMGCKDEKDAEKIQDPGDSMDVVKPLPGCICNEQRTTTLYHMKELWNSLLNSFSIRLRQVNIYFDLDIEEEKG